MVNLTIFRAASRLSIKMVSYHLKRYFRNQFCLRFPNVYKNYIVRISDDVPQIEVSDSLGVELAEYVANFYYEEYLSTIEESVKGKFTFFGQKVDFGDLQSIDWHYKIDVENDFHLWRMKLCHMGFVCPMLISGTAENLKAVEVIITNFNDNSKFSVPGCFSSYWFPYSVSHRVLAVLSGYLVARSKHQLPKQLCVQIEVFLKYNVAFILANIEHELKNNHVERNLAAICLYYDCIEKVQESVKWRIDQDVMQIVADCILSDGLLAERSAMYQGLSVVALRIFSETHFLTDATRGFSADRLAKAERAWQFMTHPDGEIGLFNDSWFGEIPKASAIVGSHEFERIETLDAAGYARISDKEYFILFDAGAIGPYWNPGHGHADFLSIELDVRGHRFIVDPGTFQYSSGIRRGLERSAQSHNGPAFDGIEPVEYRGCFKVGKMAKARLVAPVTTNEFGAVAGKLEFPAGIVSRELTILDGAVQFFDHWESKEKDLCGVVRLLIQGEWLEVECSKHKVTFRRDQVDVHILVKQGVIESLKPGEWARRYLESEAATLVTLRPLSTKVDESELTWEVISSSNVGGVS